MIALAMVLSAAPSVQVVPSLPAIEVPAPVPSPAIDPARLASAHRLLGIIQIEQQYDQLLSRMIPVLSVQIFSSLKDNVRVPARLREYLAHPENEAAARGIFSSEAIKAFKAQYPDMRRATALEYARIFSAAELDQLTSFYATPLGKKALSALPELQNRLMPVGMLAGQKAGQAAIHEMVSQPGFDQLQMPET